MRSAGTRNYLLALGLGLVVLFLYWPSLHYPFQFDDQLFLRDDNVRLTRWSAFLWPPAPRPLTWLSFTAQFAVWGEHPAPLRLLNLLLHALNSALVLLLVFKLQNLFPLPGSSDRWRAPVLAGLLFALHPLQTESVVYIYQRSTLLAALFSLLALFWWVSRSGSSRPHVLSALSLMCFFLAASSKESALVLPVALWVFDVYNRGRMIRPASLLALSLALSVVLGGSLLWWAGSSDEATIGIAGQSLTYARTQVVVIGRYLQLFLLPLGQSVDPHVEAVATWMSFGWWIHLVILLLLLGAIPWAFRSRRQLSFWLLFSFLWLLPTSSLIPSQDFMFEHRTYLPLLGFSAAFSVLVAGTSLRTWQFGSMAGLLALTLGTLTWQRIQLWEAPASLWADAARKSPGKYRPVFNFGVTLMDTSPRLAEENFRKAIQLRPELPLAYRSLAQIKWKQGNLKSAERLWRTALVIDFDHRDTLLALGRLHLEKKEFFEAEGYLQRAVTKQPTDWQARYLLGELYYGFGLTQKALDQAEEGLKFYPRQAVLRVLLADCVRRQANWKRAIELYREALLQTPGDSRSHLGLAESYSRIGQEEMALREAREAIRSATDPSERARALGVLELLGGSEIPR